MRKFIALTAMLTLTACDDLYSVIFGPSTEEQARGCGVSVKELEGAKSRVRNMLPYAGEDVGRCGVIKDDSGTVVVGFRGKELVPEGAR